ncbi:P1 family peptidase, partial [Methylobacterium sp. EM32]|uniref:P1 family peptidase n=1 Tax=Methylobacterium sp. EM32 TaxID=3163481 RepID=UPI0038B4134E
MADPGPGGRPRRPRPLRDLPPAEGVPAQGPLGRRGSGGRRPDAPGRIPMSGGLTDIAGIRVGHAEDARALSGTTAIVFDAPTVAAVDIRGGGPGTRETDLLD